MTNRPPNHTPEKKQTVDDNARKFIVEPISPQLLEDNNASSCILKVDWLKLGEDSEQKIAHKEFKDSDAQILLISKMTKDGDRVSEKESIDFDKYQELLSLSILHLEKKRHEFEYVQNGVSYSVKYDEFSGSSLCMLEVEPSSGGKTMQFDLGDFPVQLTGVSGDTRYVGYRVIEML